MNYYNDNEPFAVQWLRNLITDGLLPAGDVDSRSITEVTADDLKGYEQCHFFAGIGGWSLALEWAGWRGPVWTGSCPCQPLSSAGKRKGAADERHLWPAFQSLIAKCRPSVVFGEQVASKDGREWLAAVRFDLEQLGYACGAADLSAAGIGAPHIRQRLYWVANAESNKQREQTDRDKNQSRDGVGNSRPADGNSIGRTGLHATPTGKVCEGRTSGRTRIGLGCGSGNGRLGNTDSGGLQTNGQCEEQPFRSVVANDWRDTEYIECADGKARTVKPGLHPLADGIPGRMGQLRAYGNAIVPQVATTFIQAFMDTRDD